MIMRMGGEATWPRLALEGVLLVVGINVALWFEARFEDAREAEMERTYLVGLRDDLANDREQLELVIGWNRTKLENLEALVARMDDLPDAPPDEQAAAMWEVSGYLLFTPSDFTLQAMLESGDFRLLSDQDLKRELLALSRHYRFIDRLQVNFLQALDDEYIPMMMEGFDLLTQRITDPGLLTRQMYRNSMVYAVQDTSDRVTYLAGAATRVDALLEQIELKLASE